MVLLVGLCLAPQVVDGPQGIESDVPSHPTDGPTSLGKPVGCTVCLG